MQGASSPLIDWINKDVKTANTVSIIMIIFAAWVGIEAISNVAGIAIPPETGMATNIDPNDTQRTNNGVIIGLGAVLGTLGLVIQSLIPRGEEEQEPERGPVFDEDLVKLTKWLCSRGTTTVQFFEWADVDNSGSIDMVEFANALRAAEIANLPPWEIEELVKLMDINSDGRINLPELDIALLNIRNALGIEFIPYVEEEKTEEEAAEDSEEETEDSVTEEETVEEAPESTDNTTESDEESVETNTETETSEDEESVEDDSEEDTDEAADEESTGDEAEEEPATESEEEGSEEVEETEEAADEETTEEETEVEESDEESNDNEDASDESESDEAVEEAEDSEDESDGEETTEEVVKETPKKKKKF
ncbi:MAG: EF-hand domain-containing protein [Candidatus Poseidoniaceae archaeon]